MSDRMGIRNAILKQRMDARAKYFRELDVMRVHYLTYRMMEPTGFFGAKPELWRKAA